MSTIDPSTPARLERLDQLINEPLLRPRLRDDLCNLVTAELANYRKQGVEAISESTLEEFMRLVDQLESMLVKYSSQPPVFNLAQSGDIDGVLACIEAGFEIDDRDADGRTLLMLASENGHAELASCLIERGANLASTLNGQDDRDSMALACTTGHVEVVRLLIDRGASVNKRYTLTQNITALGLAANKGQVDVCRLLIDRGAEIEIATDSGRTALMLALMNGASEAAELLLDYGANPDPDCQPIEAHAASFSTPLILAIQTRLSPIALRLIQAGVNLDAQDSSGQTALKTASFLDSGDVVSALIEAGADLNLADKQGWTPLIIAASRASWTTMRLLINAGADVNRVGDGGTTALRHVVSRRLLRHAMVTMGRLFSRGALPSGQKEGYETALVFAEKLLQAGAEPDVTYQDDSEVILITEAKEQGDDELYALLLKFGAGAPVEDRLTIAAAHLRLNQVIDLLESGVDVNHVDGDGDTALGLCVRNLCNEELEPHSLRAAFELVYLLLEHGAKVDVPGCRMAPLPMVARSGYLALTNAFLRAGADPDAVLTDIDPDEGKTALEVAKAAGHDDVAEALLAARS